jgi:hypothetical protein
MQMIIGSGGAIGLPPAKELKAYTDKVRLVNRHAKKVNETDDLFAWGLKDFASIDNAIAGSELVYVALGFEYKLKIWQNTWPPFIPAVIDAREKHGAKLVFFDNMYVYAKSALPHMTEESPIESPSKKEP